jgi:type I restriction enzyme S subunit
MNVLLSIKPEYVDEIFKGSKKYEFRRMIFKNKRIKRVYIYATAPVGKIVGSFAVGGIIEASPAALWRKCRKAAGISRKDFFEYFRGTKRAFAIQIGTVEHLDKPVDPYSTFEDFTAPQSFLYLPPSIPELDPQNRRVTDF